MTDGQLITCLDSRASMITELIERVQHYVRVGNWTAAASTMIDIQYETDTLSDMVTERNEAL